MWINSSGVGFYVKGEKPPFLRELLQSICPLCSCSCFLLYRPPHLGNLLSLYIVKWTRAMLSDRLREDIRVVLSGARRATSIMNGTAANGTEQGWVGGTRARGKTREREEQARSGLVLGALCELAWECGPVGRVLA